MSLKPNKTQILKTQNIDTHINNTIVEESEKNMMAGEKELDVTNHLYKYKLHVKDKKCSLCEKVFRDHNSLKRHLNTLHKLIRENIDPLSSKGEWTTWIKNVNSAAMGGKSSPSLNPRKRSKTLATDAMLKQINVNRSQNKDRLITDTNKLNPQSKSQNEQIYHRQPTKNMSSSLLPLIEQCANHNDTTTENGIDFYNHTTDQSNEVQTVQMLNGIKHVSVNGWPNETQEVQTKNDETLTMYSADMLSMNTLATQPLIDQSVVYDLPNDHKQTVILHLCNECGFHFPSGKMLLEHKQYCFIDNNKQELFGGKNFTQVSKVENMFFDLPSVEQKPQKLHQNCNEMQSTIDIYNKINQSNKVQVLQAYKNKAQLTLNTTNDQSNNIGTQTYGNDTQISADTTSVFSQSTGAEIPQIYCNEADVFENSFLNETRENLVQSHQALTLYNTQLLDTTTINVHQSLMDEYKITGQQSVHKQNHFSYLCNICGALFKNEKKLVKHSQEIHSTKQSQTISQVKTDKCVLRDSSSIEKILLANYNETEVNMGIYSKPSQLNEVQILQTYKNKTQIGVKSITESVELNQIQTLQTPRSNETQINADTIPVLSQSNGAQTVQMNADRTRVWPNKTPEVQTQSNQLMTLYDAEEFDKILLETHNSIGQKTVSDWSSVHKQNNLSHNKIPDKTRINLDINNGSCQPYKVQTIQKQKNKAHVHTNGWPTEAQEIQAQSKPTIVKQQSLNFNSLKIQSFVNKSVETTNRSRKSNSEQNKILHVCDVCGDQFKYKKMLLKHKQEIHNSKLKVIVKKTDQVTANQNILIDCPIIMRETHTTCNQTQSNVNKYDTSQSSKTLTLQTYNNEIESVANFLHVSDQSDEIKTLQPHNKKSINVDTTMPSQLNETLAIQIHNDKKHVDFKSLPNESKVVQVQNDCLKIQHKARSLDTNTPKVQNSVDKSKVSSISTKPCSKKINKQPSILFELLKYKCTICKKLLLNDDSLKRHIKIVHELRTDVKQKCSICNTILSNKGSLKRHIITVHNTESHTPKTTRKRQKQKCTICKKILADKVCLKNHINRYHNVGADKQRTKQDGTHTIIDRRTIFHSSNNVLQAQSIEPYATKNMSDQPHKMLSNRNDTCFTVSSQPNKNQEFSSRVQGSETAISTKTKVVWVRNNHTNTFKTQSSVESGCQSVHDMENVSFLCPYCGIQFKNKIHFLKHNQETHAPKWTIIRNRNSQVSTENSLTIDSPSNVEIFHTNFNEKPVSVDTVDLSDQWNKVQIPQTSSNETQAHTDIPTLSSQPTIPKPIQFYSNSPISVPIRTNTSKIFNSVDEPVECGNNKKIILKHKQEIHNTKLKTFEKKVDQVSADCPSLMQETHTNYNQTQPNTNKYDTSQSSETLTLQSYDNKTKSVANLLEVFDQSGKIKTIHPHYNKIINVDKTSVPFQLDETQIIQMADNKKHVNLNSFPNESQKIQVQNDHLKIQHEVQCLDTNTPKTQSSVDKSIVCHGSRKTGKKFLNSQVCTICGKTLSNKIMLKRHIKNVHGLRMKQKCTICEKTICNSYGLLRHMKNVHGHREDIKQKCTICKKLLCDYFSWRRHMKMIHGIETNKQRTRHNSSDHSNEFQIPLTCSNKTQVCTDTTSLSSQRTKAKSIKFHCISPISEPIGTSTSEIFNSVDEPEESDQLSRSSSKQKKRSHSCQFCGVKFKNKKMLLKHTQELHSTIHKMVENKVEQAPANQHTLFDLPSIMQNSLTNYKETQSNVDMYDTTSHLSAPQILQIYNNETQLVADMFDVYNQSSEIETLQACNQETLINVGTTNVACQSKEAKATQIYDNKNVCASSWSNGTQDQSDHLLIQRKSQVLDTKYEKILFKHPQELYNTSLQMFENKFEQVPADQYTLLDLPSIMQNSVTNYKETQSNVDMYDTTSHSSESSILQMYNNETQSVANIFDVSNQSSEIKTLQDLNQEIQINSDTTNVPCQPEEAQAIQIHNNKNACENSWSNDIQDQNDCTIIQPKAQTLDTNTQYEKMILKHQQELYTSLEMLKNKVEQVPVDQHAFLDLPSVMRNSLTNYKEPQSNVDMYNTTSHSSKPQILKINDNEIQLVTNMFDVSDQSSEIQTLQAYNQETQINAGTTNVPSQSDEAQVVQIHKNEKQVYLNSRPNDTLKVQHGKPRIIHHKAPVFGIKTLKTLGSVDKSKVSSRLRKQCNDQNNISHVCNDCNIQFINKTDLLKHKCSRHDPFQKKLKTYSTLDKSANAWRLKKEKILEPICIETLATDETNITLNQSNYVQIPQSNIEVTSDTYTMSDLPKETHRLKKYENKTGVATEERSVLYSPFVKKMLQTINNKTESEPQIDIVPGQSSKIEILSSNNNETQDTCLPHNFDHPTQISNEKSQNRDRGKACPVCKKIFLKADDFKLHLVTHNSYKCDKCVLTFNSQLKLVAHRMNHESDGLFICDYVCCTGLTFVCKKSLFKHLESHKRPGRPKKY